VRDFINEPLRTYFTGIIMRLAFSVAVNVDPDTLIVDEVLGVGDAEFFAKCVEKVLEFRRAGKTLICVSPWRRLKACVTARSGWNTEE
jgi:lipopolysaccharide transport system ATP-binding protein